jgi:hypothetical protein
MLATVVLYFATVILDSVLQLLVTAYVVPSSMILSTLLKEVRHSSETLVFTTATWHHILEYGIPQNLKSYIVSYSSAWLCRRANGS